MRRELLYKMFSGNASDEEISEIREWVDSSDINKRKFFSERKIYDSVSLRSRNRMVFQMLPTISRRVFWVSMLSSVVATVCLCFYLIPLIQKEGTSAVSYNTISVPAGQRVSVSLSDGTVIWLNSLSKLTYPTSFGNGERNVKLKGEAFFDVSEARDDRNKFVVSAGKCKIKVLGTVFNVDAYDDETFSTTLLKGRIEVNDTSLLEKPISMIPNQIVHFENGRLSLRPCEKDFEFKDWRSGIIDFKEIDFKRLMRKLERNYGVRIIVRNTRLDNYVYSGKFRTSDTIEEVLNALQSDAHFSFEEKEGEIIIQ